MADVSAFDPEAPPAPLLPAVHDRVAAAAADAPLPVGGEIPVLAAPDGTPRANEKGKPRAAARVRSYIARAFGDRLDEVRAEMVALAATLPPDELNRVGFRLYEKFRPEVPKGADGWGAKGILHLDRIRSARRV